MSALRDYVESVGGLAKLNSMTKYPPIPTYHVMGNSGRLGDTVVDMGPGPLLLTEKIDGTNARIVLTPGGWLIGSREELLTADGDLVANPALGIAEAVRKSARDAMSAYTTNGSVGIVVVYGEVYGGRTTPAARNYTDSPDDFGFRVFDVSQLAGEELARIAALEREEVAAWRERGRARFFARTRSGFGAGLDLSWANLAPDIGAAEAPPRGLAEAKEWLLERISDDCRCVARRMAEGVVVRSFDSQRIAKLRIEDYARTLRPAASRRP